MSNLLSALSGVARGCLVTVVGNRPQFIKMAAVSRELERRGLVEVIVHTGQHYDHQMNQIFFEELGIRRPDIQLSISKTTHGAMTGELLDQIEQILMALEPRGLLVYGDTNSTLAASLAAVKLRVPVAHVESGPRLGDLDTPEEVNRIVADHCATLRFVNDEASLANLRREGIESGVINTGDVMFDAFLQYSRQIAPMPAEDRGPRVYMTLHRPQNVDVRDCHLAIIEAIRESDASFVFPLHPRTEKKIEAFGLTDAYRALPNLSLSGPLGYLDSLKEVLAADYVVTDSGGLQREAYFAGKMSLLMLPDTPWPELERSGWQLCVGWVRDGRMGEGLANLQRRERPEHAPRFFGEGDAAARIVDALVEHGLVGKR